MPEEAHGQSAVASGAREVREPTTGRLEPAPPSEWEQGGGAAAQGDRVRWGPIWAGLITTLATFLLLQLLASGIGLADPALVGAGGGLVSAIIGLLAFFVGGLILGITSAVRWVAVGLLSGFFGWCLGTVLMLVLSALGLGEVFGTLGSLVGQLGVLRGAVDLPNVGPAQAAQAVREASLWAFFGLLLWALAALGEWLGSRSGRAFDHGSGGGRG